MAAMGLLYDSFAGRWGVGQRILQHRVGVLLGEDGALCQGWCMRFEKLFELQHLCLGERRANDARGIVEFE
jgi:hypothetical protein